MPIDVSGFVAPVNEYEGLYKVADDMRDKNVRAEHLKQQQKANNNALGKLVSDLSDPTERLTGTDYDPHIVESYGQLLQNGMKMAAEEGMDYNTLLMRLAPQVNKLAKESETLKAIERQRKEAVTGVKGIEGIDENKFNQEFRNKAFYETDANGNRILKDITTIDPTKSLTDEVLRSGDVYNSAAFDKLFKESENITDKKKFKKINARGGYEGGDYEVTTKSYLTPNIDPSTQQIDEGQPFVPKYETVVDNDAALIHTFTNDGKNVKAPIRVLDSNVFNDLPTAAKAFALQEARKHIIGKIDPLTNKPIRPDDPRVEMFARAVAYDELNSDLRKSGSIKKIEASKANPIRNTTNTNTGNGKTSDNIAINDVYGGIETKVNDEVSKGNTEVRVNSLSSDEQKAVLEEARKLTGDNELNNEDIVLSKRGNEINIYKVQDDGTLKISVENLVGSITPKGINLNKQPSVKEKRSLLQKTTGTGNKNTPSKTISVGTIKSLVGKKGYEGYTEKELMDYYKSNGYEVK